MNLKRVRFVVLEGPPGVGKTTLVKKVTDILREKRFKVQGFFTEEVREGKERIGFDIVLLDGKRSPLARISSSMDISSARVGKYMVDINSFENHSLQQFADLDKDVILVLDEIGKMELLSIPFRNKINECFSKNNQVILATVPLKTATIPLLEMIKSHSNSILISVDKLNRNVLTEPIVNYLIAALNYQ